VRLHSVSLVAHLRRLHRRTLSRRLTVAPFVPALRTFHSHHAQSRHKDECSQRKSTAVSMAHVKLARSKKGQRNAVPSDEAPLTSAMPRHGRSTAASAPPKPNPTPHSPQMLSPLSGLAFVGLARCVEVGIGAGGFSFTPLRFSKAVNPVLLYAPLAAKVMGFDCRRISLWYTTDMALERTSR
jgi:hypothetical protein